MNPKTLKYIYLGVAVVTLTLTVLRLASGAPWRALVSGAICAFASYRLYQMREKQPRG